MASTASLDGTHPEYDCRLAQWERCQDALAGQDAVKKRDEGKRYLPPTAGMILDGMGGPHQLGYCNYKAYLCRAHFYGYYSEGVDLALGMLWNKPPVIEGIKDTPLDYLLTRATHEGESLERLLYRINEAQISTGRIGLLADMPSGETAGVPQPYISIYCETAITNWDAGYTGQLATESLNLVVLNESGPRRKNVFEWEDYSQYRVLSLGKLETNEQNGVYYQGIYTLEGGGPPDFDPAAMFTPVVQGRVLDEIPFVCINANSTTMCPQDPPMLSLADLCFHLYRLQADYSQELHGQTSATLVTKGLVKPAGKEKEPVRIGAGGHVDLGSSDSAEAYFLELSGKGLPEMRQAVESAKQLARERSGEIVDQSSRGRESGNSLEQRISVRTATLHSIAQHGAEGLQKLLRIMAKWLNMSEQQIADIKVTPNTVFAKPTFSGIELEALTKAKMSGGAIIPYAAIHAYLVARGFTTQSFDEFKTAWESDKEIETQMQTTKAEGEGMTAKAVADAQPKPTPSPGPSGPQPKEDSEDEDENE